MESFLREGLPLYNKSLLKRVKIAFYQKILKCEDLRIIC